MEGVFHRQALDINDPIGGARLLVKFWHELRVNGVTTSGLTAPCLLYRIFIATLIHLSPVHLYIHTRAEEPRTKLPAGERVPRNV